MTKAEFEKKYAKESGMSIKQLHKLGLRAKSCECGEPSCNSWRMEHKLNEESEDDDDPVS